LKSEVHGRLGEASRLRYTRVLQIHRQDLGEFGRNGVSQKQRYQHRGIDNVSLIPMLALEVIGALSHIPRNSTQLISTSSLSPSVDNGRSSSKLRSTNGPASVAGRFLLLDVDSSESRGSILKQLGLKPASSLSRLRI
jgi:hypothetical protein